MVAVSVKKHVNPLRKGTEQEYKYWDDVWNTSDESGQTFADVYSKLERMLEDAEPDWDTTDDHKILLKSLSYYILGSEKDYIQTTFRGRDIYTQSRLSVRKGLLFVGSVGTGKTTIMRVVCKMLGAKFTTARKIIEHKEESGTFRKFEVGEWCIDDLGAERESVYAKSGQTKELSGLLEQRHAHNHGRTFISTNMDVDQIGEAYGMRVKSRLPEMFNIYHIGGVDRRLMK